MSISEKLTTIAENQEKVYNKGGLDYSPQETVSGEAIGITDISPIEHNMGVSVRGKNILKPKAVGVYKFADTLDTFEILEDGGVHFASATNNTTAVVNALPFNTLTIQKSGVYAFSQKGNVSGLQSVVDVIRNGTHTYYYGNNTISLQIGDVIRIYVQLAKGATITDVLIYCWIEEGTTPTSYAPYIEDISTVKLYKQGKNLIKFPYVNSSYNINYKAGVEKTTAGITFTVNDDGSVYVRGTATNSAFFNLCKRDLKTNYNIAIEGGENGTTNKTTNLSVSKRTVYQESNSLMYLYIPKGVTIDELLYPQIEYGSRTEFEPYIEPTVYDVQSDGIVEGVKSLYPNTTLYTDTSGAVIDCTYYQDGKKVKENLTDMILELGGVINE